MKTETTKIWIKLPNGCIEAWPAQLAYAMWLAIPGTEWNVKGKARR